MFGGKYLWRILPFVSWGTHCTINRHALRLLNQGGVRVGKDFPPLSLINHFEDFQGPDGEWIRGNLPSSKMTYNPRTGDGDAPQEASRFFKKLVLSLRKRNLDTAAKDAAWLSHIVVDLLWPPHQIGRYHDRTIQFFFWKIRSNWEDGRTSAIWHREDCHTKFETLAALSVLRRKILPGSIDHAYVARARENLSSFEEYLRNKALLIREKGLYQTFIREGWGKEIRRMLDTCVFPTMISVVGTLWNLAHLLRQERRVQ